MVDIDALERLCDAASQDERKVVHEREDYGGYGEHDYIWIEPLTRSEGMSDGMDAHRCGADFDPADAALIAATGPKEIRELIARVRSAESEVARLKDKLWPIVA